MKQIKLTQGQFAIVDDKNYEWLSQYKWFAIWNKDTQSFYVARKCKQKDGKQYTISMAREILGLKKGDKQQIDHIDHITLDNRGLNLRIVTRRQNQWNRKNVRGYFWNRINKRYIAKIVVNGKKMYLGSFKTTEEAHNAYLMAKAKYHKF